MLLPTGDFESTTRSAIPHEKAIKWLFALVIMCQPLQYIFIAKFGEPYPALTMPRFDGAQTDATRGVFSAVKVEERVLFEDSSIAWVSRDDLLDNAPGGQRSEIMSFMFRPLESTSQPASGGLKQRIREAVLPLLPGLAAKRAKRTQQTPDPRTVRWLDQRLRTLFPTRTAISVTFVWSNETYHVSPAGVERSDEVTGTYEVSLDGAR
jgi:hypothetical protein